MKLNQMVIFGVLLMCGNSTVVRAEGLFLEAPEAPAPTAVQLPSSDAQVPAPAPSYAPEDPNEVHTIDAELAPAKDCEFEWMNVRCGASPVQPKSLPLKPGYGLVLDPGVNVASEKESHNPCDAVKIKTIDEDGNEATLEEVKNTSGFVITGFKWLKVGKYTVEFTTKCNKGHNGMKQEKIEVKE